MGPARGQSLRRGAGSRGIMEAPPPPHGTVWWGGPDGFPEGEGSDWPGRQTVVHHGLVQPVGITETQTKGSE